ncbi:efflux RND transporter permease subunit [Vibrio sp. RC27]
MDKPLGVSGRIAAMFQHSAITPLLAIVGMLMGLFAVMVTPKEEEPQIDVTFADIYIPFPGASPQEVESLVTNPAEQIISEMQGIDKIYSFSRPDGALIIAIFEVGVSRNDAVVRTYNKLYSNNDWMPQGVGVGQPVIKPKGIEDVPIVSITLSDKTGRLDNEQLTQVASGLETELKRIQGTRDIYTIGKHSTIVDVRLDPIKMNGFGITLDQLNQTLVAANASSSTLKITHDNQQFPVQVGQFLTRVEDVKQLVIGMNENRPVYLSDVAEIKIGADTPSQNVWTSNKESIHPAVTIAVAKKAGENAVDVANQVETRLEELKNQLIPENISVDITRDYGQTAAEKSSKLIGKLAFATAAVVLLVILAMGWREAIVVGIAIVITLMITLFASWAWGFTLNRVSLFALIFSIGILVDDAIVVVENIHRHMALGKRKLKDLIPIAVDEVGGPTILATLTVIAALLPMAFVSGLMGPYMSPIPINASMGMLISLAVAFVLSPWLASHLLKDAHHEEKPASKGVFYKVMAPFVLSKRQRRNRWFLLLGIFALIAGSLILPLTKTVVMKMLPFDNKSEFQVVLDMPDNASLEKTQRLLFDVGRELSKVPEVTDYQIYVGTAAPINFNGLVRHYFTRSDANQGDIQVNLVDKNHRDKSSHQIASEVRPALHAIAEKFGGKLKVVEVPPGPPVWSPILAEVYGPTHEIRKQAAREIREVFKATDDIVDVDIYLPEPYKKWQVVIDRNKASLLQVPYNSIVDAISTAVGGQAVTYLHNDYNKYPIPVQVQASESAKVRLEQVMNMMVGSSNGSRYPLSDLVTVRQTDMDDYIVHKNLVPTVMVVADMSGSTDSPLYGMFDVYSELDNLPFNIEQNLIEQPSGIDKVAVLWDGEWTITYETFRDMGIAYGVGMILIYLLVVAQFRSYLVPLIIMAPIPLTIIGVMPGHAILGAQFTATSMIGMIALAGIIVRNSILLVDFINQQVDEGMAFADAVINSASVRAKPIMLTALAAMIGAVFILDDPIFNGLAISLIFGIFVSTVLTLVVIPVLYYVAMKERFTLEVS